MDLLKMYKLPSKQSYAESIFSDHSRNRNRKRQKEKDRWKGE